METNRARTITAAAFVLCLGIAALVVWRVMDSDSSRQGTSMLQVSPATVPSNLPAAAGPAQDAKPFQTLGDKATRRGEIDKAIELYQKAIEADPANHWYWYMGSCLLAQKGNAAAYEAHCEKMLARFRTVREAYILERVAKGCLLMPRPPEVVANIRQALDAMMTRNIAAGQMPWMNLTSALVDYRGGRFDQSIESAAAARDAAQMNLPGGKVTADLLMAMAQARLGHTPESRASLAAAEDRIKAQMPGLNQGNFGGGLDNWLICSVLRREATKIAGTTNAAAP